MYVSVTTSGFPCLAASHHIQSLFQTKICDFGMARVIEESEAMMSLNVASRRIPYAW